MANFPRGLKFLKDLRNQDSFSGSIQLWKLLLFGSGKAAMDQTYFLIEYFYEIICSNLSIYLYMQKDFLMRIL